MGATGSRCGWVAALALFGLLVGCTRPPPPEDDVVQDDTAPVDTADTGAVNGGDFNPNGPCSPGEKTCSKGQLWSCKTNGSGYNAKSCPAKTPLCVVDRCLVCLPNAASCGPAATPDAPSTQVQRCDDTGKVLSLESICDGTQVCLAGQCVACQPGKRDCDGTRSRRCRADGSAWDVVEDCSLKGLICDGGVCDTSCPVDHPADGNLGCEFWAVDLDQLTAAGDRGFDAKGAPFGLLIANPGDDAVTLHVTADVVGAGGAKSMVWQVQPKSSATFQLPPTGWGVGQQGLEGSGISRRAFRIRTSAPVAAWQLNPMAGNPMASADGSMLLPSSALGEAHRSLAQRQYDGADNGAWRAGLTVIATRPGNTAVTVFAKIKMLGGPDVPAMTLGDEPIFNLQQGDVLNLQSDTEDGDLSGMWVGSGQPVAVFGSNEAALAPATGNCVPNSKGNKVCAGVFDAAISCNDDAGCPSPCCGDHLEGQLLPQSLWGKVYVAAHLARRGKEGETWRVVTGQDQTIVNLEPLIGVQVPQMDSGQSFTFHTHEDFVLKSNAPIQLARITSGSKATVTSISAPCSADSECKQKYDFEAVCGVPGAPGICQPLGDPALLIEIPTERFRARHAIAVPEGYTQSWLQITAPPGSTVAVDGLMLGPGKFEKVASSTWRVARRPVKAGYHVVDADQPVGVQVYGWGPAVAFAWPGGISSP